MKGCALIPTCCHTRANRWKRPKCNRKTRPIMPTQPTSNGDCDGVHLGAPQTSAAPASVLKAAKIHSENCGLSTKLRSAKNSLPSTPGQPKRYSHEQPAPPRGRFLPDSRQ